MLCTFSRNSSERGREGDREKERWREKKQGSMIIIHLREIKNMFGFCALSISLGVPSFSPSPRPVSQTIKCCPYCNITLIKRIQYIYTYLIIETVNIPAVWATYRTYIYMKLVNRERKQQQITIIVPCISNQWCVTYMYSYSVLLPLFHLWYPHTNKQTHTVHSLPLFPQIFLSDFECR